MNKNLAAISLLLSGTCLAQLDNTLTPAEEAMGWKMLFDGTAASLEKFTFWGRDNENNQRRVIDVGWEVRDGFFYPLKGSAPDIRTDKKYGDFVVTMDYRTNGRQGFLYRASLCGAAIWWSSVMYSINNNSSDISWTATPGAAWSLYEPIENNFKGDGQINQLAVLAVGPHVEHWHNGVKVVEYETWSEDFENQFNKFWRDRGSDSKCFARPYEPGEEPIQKGYATTGYLGMQGNHGGVWQVKNFKILENPVVGCLDSTAIGWNKDATWDPPQSLCGEHVPGGCKIPDDLNYNPEAQWHDSTACSGLIIGTHEYHPGVFLKASGADGRITVSYPNKTPMVANIMDLQGRVLSSKKRMGSRDITFPLQPGIYFLRIELGSEKILKRVLVH